MKRRKKLKEALEEVRLAMEEVRLATRVAREWDEKRVLKVLRAFAKYLRS